MNLLLFVFVMPFQFDDKYGYSVIVNVVDDSVVRSDMP